MASSASESTKATTGQGQLARGRLNTTVIIFLVMAIVAPIAGAGGPVALGMALGNGAGMPGAYLIATVILFFFAVGYAAMSRHVRETGAFYAYITKGLGRPMGGAAAFSAMLAYNAAFCAMCGYIGFFAKMFVLEHTGFDMPWYVYTAIALIIIGLLGRRDVGVSSRLLVSLLVLEVGLFLVFDVGVVVRHGFDAFSLTSFSPATIWTGGWGGFSVAMMFAIFCFGGVEQAAVYAEEARRPERTVGRATIGAVAAIGLFYIFTSWCLTAAAGYQGFQDKVLADPGMFGLNMIGQVLGSSAQIVMNVLILTSILASMTGLHQAISRYSLALARDGLLPQRLARVHPVRKVPQIASASAIGLAALVTLAFALAGADPLLTLASALSGITTIGTLLLWAWASVAFLVFFRRRSDPRWVTTFVMPLVSFILMAGLLYLSLTRYGLLTGVETGWINNLQWLFLPVIAAGGGIMLYLRSKKRETYELIWPDEMGSEPVTAQAATVQLPTERGLA